MKPTVQEDIEDDLAAEEENKLINEVRQRVSFIDKMQSINIFDLSRNTKLGKPPCISDMLDVTDLSDYRKKNAPYLYDLVITHALDWPSLTCQWFPDKESYVPSSFPLNPNHPYDSYLRPPNKPYTVHRLLLGTHTSGQAQDYLQIATVQIPKRAGSGADKLDRDSYDDERGELGGYSIPSAQPRIQVIQKINHAGEVNRARYMPQNPDLIATKAVTGEVFIFDRTKHSSEPERGGLFKPDITLAGQNKEG